MSRDEGDEVLYPQHLTKSYIYSPLVTQFYPCNSLGLAKKINSIESTVKSCCPFFKNEMCFLLSRFRSFHSWNSATWMTSEKDPCFRFTSTQHLTTGQAEVLLEQQGAWKHWYYRHVCCPLFKRATQGRSFKKSPNCKGLNWSFWKFPVILLSVETSA